MLRFNWLSDNLDILERAVERAQRGLRLGTPLEMLHMGTILETFQELTARPVSHAFTFRFLSPTYISRSGRDYLLPDPEVIYAGLASRWNLFAPLGLQIPENLGKSLNRSLILLAHEIRSARTEDSPSMKRTGFVGIVRFGVLTKIENPEDTLKWFTALSWFAEYSGVGAQTTRGLGAVTVAAETG